MTTAELFDGAVVYLVDAGGHVLTESIARKAGPRSVTIDPAEVRRDGYYAHLVLKAPSGPVVDIYADGGFWVRKFQRFIFTSVDFYDEGRLVMLEEKESATWTLSRYLAKIAAWKSHRKQLREDDNNDR